VQRDHDTLTGRVALEGRAIQIRDVLADPDYRATGYQQAFGYRTALAVPLLREEATIGVFFLSRDEVNPFNEKQIELVTTFADQAVIAIENARLLNELRQSLEQQTATSEVLQIISRSPSDLEPVFASMLDNAVRICDAKFGSIYRWTGGALHLVASRNAPAGYAEARRRLDTTPQQGDPMDRVLTTKGIIHIADFAAEPSYVAGHNPQVALPIEQGGVRTGLLVPMLLEDEPIGVFSLFRQEVRPFTDKEIALVANFAAQAVIAIENARLLRELREKTDELAAQSQELAKLNQYLEQRVTDQVDEIERMSRLRRFLPPQVADLIVAFGSEKQLESHRGEITALFCDLRGFTGFTESADAEDVMALLRDYHAAIGQIIIKYNGTLERYAGDGVMVVFNDPVPVENSALQAVLMALEVREAIGALTERWRRWGHDLGFGIGIAHGFATLGTIGFEGRFDYAAIGTVSNVASRLCDEAKPGQILISPRVLAAVEKAVKVEPVGEFELKGIRRPLAAYNVLSAAS
jgi:class 3 adenylate cyclase